MLPYNFSRHTPHQPVRRVPSFKTFTRMGGSAGMVREIIRGWNHPFTVNQLKVAFHRRHPDMILGDFQIDDMLAYMAERGRLFRLDDGSFQRPQLLQHAA